jgi:hypothetical protein
MIKRAPVFAIVLVLLTCGMSLFVAGRKPIVQAAPQLQETSTPRPTPTNEPQPTSEPQPTNTPEAPTTPPRPTNTPVPPTRAPKPTSKPKPPSEPAATEAPAPTTTALDKIPTTGFGSVGGWTLGVTGLVLVCVLVAVRHLRTRKASAKENDKPNRQSSNHHHSSE